MTSTPVVTDPITGAVVPEGVTCPSAGQTVYDYVQFGSDWGPSDSFTVANNTDRDGTETGSVTVTGSLSTTVSGEVGLQAGEAVAQLNAKFGVAVTLTATISQTYSFSVPVPAHKKVTGRAGIFILHYSVYEYQIDEKCNKNLVGTGTVDAVKKYAELDPA